MTISEAISLSTAFIALVGAAAAWGAIIANQKTAAANIRAQINIAARSSRAAVVSANRQNWINAIREDVAEFISIRSRLASLEYAGSFQIAGQDALLTEERDLRTTLMMVHAKIEMRLNHGEDDHRALLAALDKFDSDTSHETAKVLREVSRKIFKDEWTRLKKEASGIDPFVKEAIPERTI